MDSLRERSKARRRRAIQCSAMRLFAQHGYDGATIADIAEDAEVGARTVSLYFPTKLEIALSTSIEPAERLIAAVRAHPKLSFTGAVDLWLTQEAQFLDPEMAALTTAMFSSNPALRGFFSNYFAESTRVNGPALAAELGLPPEDPLVPVVHAAVGAALTTQLSMTQRSVVEPDAHQSFMRYLRALIRCAQRTVCETADARDDDD